MARVARAADGPRSRSRSSASAMWIREQNCFWRRAQTDGRAPHLVTAVSPLRMPARLKRLRSTRVETDVAEFTARRVEMGEQFQPLRGEAVTVSEGITGDGGLRARQVGDDAPGDRITRSGKYERDRGGGVLGCAGTDILTSRPSTWPSSLKPCTKASIPAPPDVRETNPIRGTRCAPCAHGAGGCGCIAAPSKTGSARRFVGPPSPGQRHRAASAGTGWSWRHPRPVSMVAVP